MERVIVACVLLSCGHALASPVGRANATAPAITFVSVETRGRPWLSKIGNFPEPVINAASGLAWPNIGVYRLKVQLLSRWLEKQPASQLVVFVDGDVFWGGCSLNELVDAYQGIIRQTGAKVVFGAELSCTDQDCRKVPEVPTYAHKSIADWAKYAACPGSWSEKCASSRSCIACQNPPTPKFLNSGFIMGPAGYLLKMTLIVGSRFTQWSTATQGDQGVFAEYWLQNLKDVTLDYETKLVMNLAFTASNATELDKKTGKIINKARKHTQCFLHGNGPAKSTSRQLIQDMGYDPDGIQEIQAASMVQSTEQHVNADGSMGRAKAHPEQDKPMRRLARRHEHGTASYEKVAQEHKVHMIANDIRTEEGARFVWRGM